MDSQLCINITGTSAHFAEVLRSTEELVNNYELKFSSFREDEIKNELLDFISKHDLRRDFTEYSLAFWNNQYTLVPFGLVDAKNYSDAFKLSFGNAHSKQEVDYNMLPQLGISSIFYMPEWIKSFFITKYPRLVIQHVSSLSLGAMDKESSYKPTIEIQITENHFYIHVFHHSELKFSNAFEYGGINDIVYHSLLVLQKLGFSTEKGKCTISSLNNSTALKELKDLFSKIDELKNISFHISENNYIKHHLLCV